MTIDKNMLKKQIKIALIRFNNINAIINIYIYNKKENLKINYMYICKYVINDNF